MLCCAFAAAARGQTAEVAGDLSNSMLQLRSPDGVQIYLPLGSSGKVFFLNRPDLEDPRDMALQIRCSKREDGVWVQIYVLPGASDRGSEETPKPILAAEFQARIEEQVRVAEPLEALGFEPLLVKLVNAFPSTRTPVELVLNTPSTPVAEIVEKQNQFVVVLSNNTPKRVISLFVNNAGRFSWPGASVAEPFETLEFIIPKESAERKPDDPPFRIEVKAVVFEDFSFEGRRDKAQESAAQWYGLLLGLRRTVPLLNEMAQAPGEDVEAAVSELAERLTELHSRFEVEEAWGVPLLGGAGAQIEIPQERLLAIFNAGRRWAPQSLLSDLNDSSRRFLQSDGRQASFLKWLSLETEIYGERLEQAERVFEGMTAR